MSQSQSGPNYNRGQMGMPDEYGRNNRGMDFHPRNTGPSSKRQRIDRSSEGHWEGAPTDRPGSGPMSMGHQRNNNNNNNNGSMDDFLTASRNNVSAFFQTATDEEMRGYNQTLRVFQK